jgi:uridine phosphorylase
MVCVSYFSDDAARPDVRRNQPAVSLVDVPFPTVPDKHGQPGAYRPAAFLEALRAGGWEPGPVPESVVFTYARFESYLAAHPEAYTPNHMLGPGPGRFFLVNATGGRVGLNCLGIGAPAAAAQLEVQAELGVSRCVSIGTAGGFQASQEPGDVVLLTSAVRDEGTSYHYLPAGSPAVPDEALTRRFAGALDAAGIARTAGATVTTDAPYRTTAEEIRVHRASGARSLEMEAAALFAVGQVRGLPVASAVVIDGVPDEAGTAFRIDNRRAAEVLRELFAATIGWLAG